MLKYVFDQKQMECLNHAIGEKNDISVLNSYGTRELSEAEKQFFVKQDMMTTEGVILDSLKDKLSILSKPMALVRIMFTGGVGRYEHTVSYDETYKKHIAFTSAPNYYSVDDESDIRDVLNVIEDFVGKSSLKSVSIQYKLSVPEALVVAAMLDMERRTLLRAFVDEIPYSNNRYGFNMIWRMIHSSSPSIQWFVYCISEVIGEQITLNRDKVQKVLEQLVTRGLILENDGQYELSADLCQLANRMIVIDNVLTVETIGTDLEKEPVSAGFTCIQSGIHDMLFIDYDGSEVMVETISSILLLDYLERFLKLESFLTKN